MKKANLLSSTKTAHFKITDRGRNFLKEKPDEITSKDLTRFDEFVKFQTVKKTPNKKTGISNDVKAKVSDQTPEEVLEYAYQKIKNDIANELIDIIKNCSLAFFEKLVR